MSNTFEVTGEMAILMARIDESDDLLSLDSFTFTEAAEKAIHKMREEGLILRSAPIALTEKGFNTMVENPAYQKLIRQRREQEMRGGIT